MLVMQIVLNNEQRRWAKVSEERMQKECKFKIGTK